MEGLGGMCPPRPFHGPLTNEVTWLSCHSTRCLTRVMQFESRMGIHTTRLKNGVGAGGKTHFAL